MKICWLFNMLWTTNYLHWHEGFNLRKIFAQTFENTVQCMHVLSLLALCPLCNILSLWNAKDHLSYFIHGRCGNCRVLPHRICCGTIPLFSHRPTPVQNQTIPVTEKHLAGIYFVGHFLLRLSGNKLKKMRKLSEFDAGNGGQINSSPAVRV